MWNSHKTIFAYGVLMPRETRGRESYRDLSLYNIRKIHGLSNPMAFRPLCVLSNRTLGPLNHQTQYYYKIRWEKYINVIIKKKKRTWQFIAFSVWHYIAVSTLRFNHKLQNNSEQYSTGENFSSTRMKVICCNRNIELSKIS